MPSLLVAKRICVLYLSSVYPSTCSTTYPLFQSSNHPPIHSSPNPSHPSTTTPTYSSSQHFIHSTFSEASTRHTKCCQHRGSSYKPGKTCFFIHFKCIAVKKSMIRKGYVLNNTLIIRTMLSGLGVVLTPLIPTLSTWKAEPG